jgi:hypothetical protein
VPIAFESQAAKAIASVCQEESSSPGPALMIRLVQCRPPWQTRARLRPGRPDLREPASKPLPLIAGILRFCHKRPVAERHSPPMSPHFPCCQPVWRTPQPASSAPMATGQVAGPETRRKQGESDADDDIGHHPLRRCRSGRLRLTNNATVLTKSTSARATRNDCQGLSIGG